jgi:hypothetical protein
MTSFGDSAFNMKKLGIHSREKGGERVRGVPRARKMRKQIPGYHVAVATVQRCHCVPLNVLYSRADT